MLVRRASIRIGSTEAALGQLLTTHIAHVKRWLIHQPNFQLLEIDYNQMLNAPGTNFVAPINHFLDDCLDVAAMTAMIIEHSTATAATIDVSEIKISTTYIPNSVFLPDRLSRGCKYVHDHSCCATSDTGDHHIHSLPRLWQSANPSFC